MKIDKYNQLKLFKFSRLNSLGLGQRCLIIGSFGANNLGDEAILAGQISELKKNGFKNIVVAGENPDLIKSLHNVKAIRIKNISSLMSNLINANILIVGGGGIFCKSSSLVKGLFYQTFISSIIFTAYVLNKKVYILGIGFYKNQNVFIKRIQAYALRKADLVIARDFHSYEQLKKENVDVEIFKDFAFFMDLYSKKDLLTKTFARNNYEPSLENIGISLVNHKYNEKYKKKILKELSKFIYLHPKAKYWYFTLDSGYGINSDFFIGKELEQIINRNRKSKIKFVFVPYNLHPKEVFSLLKLMDFAIVTRFHAILFSYRIKIKFIGISYEIKCSSLLESIGKNILKLSQVSSLNLRKGYSSKKLK